MIATISDTHTHTLHGDAALDGSRCRMSRPQCRLQFSQSPVASVFHHCVLQPDCFCDSVSIHFFSTSTWAKRRTLGTKSHGLVILGLSVASYLAAIARPAGDVLLRLDVVGGAQRHHAGLRHHSAHDLTLHGDKGVPVSRDLLVGSQLQLAGEGMGMIRCCVGRKQKAACQTVVA